MNIQIGMSCEPTWLCNGIGWIVAVVVISLLGLLIRSVYREHSALKRRKRR